MSTINSTPLSVYLLLLFLLSFCGCGSSNNGEFVAGSSTSDITSVSVAPSSTPTPVPSNTPSPVPSNTPTPVPSSTPTPVPSNTPTPVPSNTPTPDLSDAVKGVGIQSSSTLELSAASFLGGGADDGIEAAAIGPSRKIVLGGKVDAVSFNGITPVDINVGTPPTGGALFLLSGDGRRVLSVSRIGSRITDLAINPTNGEILVATPEQVVLLNSTGNTIVWSAGRGGTRVDLSADGTIAYISGKSTFIVSADRSQSEELRDGVDYAATELRDVCVEPTTSRVIVAGWQQRNGGVCGQWQSAWLKAYSYTGTSLWTAYDWSNTEAGNASLCADTRMLNVARGQDGALYAAGFTAGGNSVFQRQPQSIGTTAPLVSNDNFNTPFNTSSNHILFFGRFSAADGSLSRGQIVLTRLSNGRGNTIEPRAITADAKGNVYVAGLAAASLENRNNLFINGSNIGPYSGGDGYLLVTSPDLSQRKLWTSFTAGGRMTGSALAVSDDQVVFAGSGRQNTGQTTPPFVTVEPVQSTFTSDINETLGFFAVFKAP